MQQAHAEVLVVGAGPVGLWTALSLAEKGIEVSLIDRESRTAARSYACALHPATLKLLDDLGLAESAIDRGRRLETVAFYGGAERQGEIHFSKLGGPFPFLLILPQSGLEGLLEQRLRAAGVQVHWNHRFEELALGVEDISAGIDELEGTSTGYIVPHWETVVKNRANVSAEFLIGADGHNSMIRSRAGFDYQRVGETESFAAIEFESQGTIADELRVVMDDATTNVLWPLAENRYRWTFQLLRSELSAAFPEKERRAVRVDQPTIDERIRQYLQKVASQRAPWFTSEIKRVHWCSEASFERRLVTQFGRNRCWLIGDAAHQTGPVGVQSMNMGFREGALLAGILHKILREGASLSLLDSGNRDLQKDWQLLLGRSGGLKAQRATSPWIASHAARILPCLPSCGPDLQALASQLNLVAS